MKISEAVAEIRSTQGKIAKRARLAEAMKDPTFVEFLKAMYNPLVRYNINKIPEFQSGGSLPMADFFAADMLRPLVRREVTGNAAADYLRDLLEKVDDPEALIMIIKRDMDSGVSVNSVNSVIKDLIKGYPVMLCQAYSKKLAESFTYPAISQIKEDGLRGNIVVREGGVISTFSRNGKDLGLDEVFAFVGAKYPNGGFVLDGEVRVLNKAGDGYEPRKIGNGIINSCAKGGATPEEMSRVVFVAWDIIPLSCFDAAKPSAVGTLDRFANLGEIVKDLNTPQLVLVEHRVVDSWDEAVKHFAEAIDEGQEGTILKSRDGKWMPGRPKTQMKLKLGELDFGDGKYNRECDLEIIGFKEGNKKYKGKMGAVIYASSDRKLQVSVGGGWSDKDREEIWNKREELMGKIGTVRYNEKINSGDRWSLFLPRIVEGVRMDKDVADSFDDIK